MQSTFSDWFSQFTQTQLIVAAILLVVVIAFAVGVFLSMRKRRTRALRTRFGSEYDRAVVTHGYLAAGLTRRRAPCLHDRAQRNLPARIEPLLRDIESVVGVHVRSHPFYSPLPHRGRGNERDFARVVRGCWCSVKSLMHLALDEHPLTLTLSPCGVEGNTFTTLPPPSPRGLPSPSRDGRGIRRKRGYRN